MDKFNIIFENIKNITDILKDCEVVYNPGDENNPLKCKSCGKDIEGKLYKLKDGNMCEKCFNLFIKKPKKLNNGEDKDLIKEGGHAFSDVGPIKKENIKPTLEKFNHDVFEPLKISNDLWTAEIGSVGKKNESGDIDIAINMQELIKVFNVSSINEVKDIIINKLKSLNIEIKKVGANIHLKYPINGLDEEKFVQIDLFPSTDLNYTKIKMFSPTPEESKYKGVHRIGILASLIKAVTMNIAEDAIDDEKNEYIAPDGRKYPGLRFSYISVTNDGFFQVTNSFKGKKGILKTPQKDESKSKFITKDFQEILNIIFGEEKYTIDDIKSFETIWNNILMDESFPYKEKRDDIIVSLFELFKDQNIEIPNEILKYLKKI